MDEQERKAIMAMAYDDGEGPAGSPDSALDNLTIQVQALTEAVHVLGEDVTGLVEAIEAATRVAIAGARG